MINGNKSTLYDQPATPKAMRRFFPTAIRNLTIERYTSMSQLNVTFEEFSDEEVDVAEQCNNIYIYVEFLNKYYLPFVIAGGLTGNALSCTAFLNTPLKTRSSSYYLAALSVADFGFLLSVFCVYLAHADITSAYNTPGICQAVVYLSSVCSFLSVWLIVAFSVERFVAVQYPLQRPHVCTVARAKMIVLFLIIAALITQSYSVVTAGILETEDGEVCELLPEYLNAMRVINIVDTMITLVVPLFIIVAVNAAITRNLLAFRRRHLGPQRISSSSRAPQVTHFPVIFVA